MPKNKIQQRSSKTSDNPMEKNQFFFKFTVLPTTLENDPSVMKYQFHFKVDKNRELGDPEPVYKPLKRRSSQSKSTLQPYTLCNNHSCSPASVTPSLYNNASSPIFFTTLQGSSRPLSPQPTNLDGAATSNKTIVTPSIVADKIKISNLVNNQIMDEKKLDRSTINALAETFQIPAESLETELSTAAKRW